ncbi:hypothetical protein [Microbacterium sp. SD291]|uniref:hypothetical protein n=1 Tax=Microbacterium sp. SD291 TaxID=2782007 RepID=UPI001A95F75F|nr:hypothetical protein [Microbacterium sp. SD291]MBO0981972.1 hypothetical protein [Microbacterium sp. SD291]
MTTVEELFTAAGVSRVGVASWGIEVPLRSPGVYVVASSEDPTADDGAGALPIDIQAVHELLRERPEATIDGVVADADHLIRRLQRMWVAGQPVVYVGLAGASVRDRVAQFYSTPIGARAPHSGGWPVKMIDQSSVPLWVHFGSCADPDRAEKVMIDRFVRGVTAEVAGALADPNSPLPFANLTFPGGRRKRHGIRGVRKPLLSRSTTASEEPAITASSTAVPRERVSGARRRTTQNVTDGDIKSGKIRIPAISKDIFPAARTRITVRVGIEAHEVSWDPRTGGDHERSGVIGMGKNLMLGFSPGGRLEILESDGEFHIR